MLKIRLWFVQELHNYYAESVVTGYCRIMHKYTLIRDIHVI